MDAANLTIRPAKVADAAKLNRYIHLVYRSSSHLITTPNEFATGPLKQRLWIAGKDTNPFEICLVALSGKQIVGMLDSWTDRRERVSHVTTFAMSVHPDFRGRGIGADLLDSFIAWVQANPRLEKIELHVHADNDAAIALYKKTGFEVEGIRERAIRYNNKRFVDDVLMAYWPNSSNVENE